VGDVRGFRAGVGGGMVEEMGERMMKLFESPAPRDIIPLPRWQYKDKAHI
jgi:hypothetical protein